MKTASNDTAQLLARDNLDMSKLECFVREVANYVTLPSSCPFAKNHAGSDDVAIFDFSKKQQSIKHYKLFGSEEGNKGFAALVGDALIEPFWPLGTGMYMLKHTHTHTHTQVQIERYSLPLTRPGW